MAHQLVSISGTLKGAAWVLGEEGVVFGRDPACDIVLPDSAVSRRHCRIYRDGDTLRFEDLGSLNPTLVNGVPAETAVLHTGDEIAIDRERFLLISMDSGASRDLATSPGQETIPWEKAEPVTLKLGSTRPLTEGRPRTVYDLALLYEVTRELTGAETMDEFVSTLRKLLIERFKPLHLWIALVGNKDEVTLCEQDEPGPTAAASPPLEAIRSALRKSQGQLTPTNVTRGGRKSPVFTLASPIPYGGVNVGALVLQTEPPHGAYDEEDLRLLVLLCQSLGSLICALESAEQLRRDNAQLRARAGESETLVGKSRAIRQLRGRLSRAASSDLNVLITGETGSGKELAARLLHAQSTGRTRPFIVVNCAAIPRDLFESELFGYEKGAFTGAREASVGLLTQAHSGILFLDEVGDLSLDNQARILRVVEYGTFRRIGAKEESRADFRVIAATNRDLAEAIKRGAFREDLYHRLNGFEIHVPALRERPSDIPLLVEHFFELARDQAKRPLVGIDPDSIDLLKTRAWPGNVRELRNCVMRAVSVAKHDTVRLDDFISSQNGAATDRIEQQPLLSLRELEKRHIKEVLDRCGGSMREAAKVLEVARSTLYVKVAEYDIR